MRTYRHLLAVLLIARESQDGSYRFGFFGGADWTSQDGSESFLFGVRFREGEAPAEPPGLRIPGLYHTYLIHS